MSGPPRRVLVVEDESAQRLMYRKALGSFGYEAECAESSAAALACLASGPFGVALLDLNLGPDRGMDLFETIRERNPSTSVVVATGHGSVEAMRRAIRLDVVDFLVKPIALDELEAALAKAWARHELVETPVDELEDPASDFASLVARAPDLDLESIEHAAIREALRRCDNNRKEAAGLLGLSERTLYYRLSRYRVRKR